MSTPRESEKTPSSGGGEPQDGAARPERIGRYRVERELGRGGFGVVYLAYDEHLQRRVAVKTPYPELVRRPGSADAYLAEARAVAQLDHPNIAPVHDAGSDEDFPVYIVSKFVNGSSLATKIRSDRPSCRQAARLTAVLAEALHYAHTRGVVHRDVKPGNILVEWSGEPILVDFGLALREGDVGQGNRYAGTPAYASPEQARGEGHRVDGRSDIFSLGVTFYELLVGRRPFQAAAREELLEQIAAFEPRPVRQLDDSIPREVERICFKALAKRASDRYMTAKDMAEDLQCFLDEGAAASRTMDEEPVRSAPVDTSEAADATVTFTPSALPVRIVPKGLRSFDEHDTDFFLELLPGPRDRDGLPDSIRFWKTCIEERDADSTFPVGLIYGPTGCGKSSLVKAGLLPRLSDEVAAVYVESAANETEARLLNGLRKHCPSLPRDTELSKAIGSLRRGQSLPPGKKVLLVLDQFEQWLHANKDVENAELVRALRQCDGASVQCLVMVRDDFWMAATRFMRQLEVPILEGVNSAAADLFDDRHAKKVLTALGLAYSRLPENSARMTALEKRFIDRAVDQLSQNGKVICVRLSLFAEMMKSRPWTPSSLREVGGAEGVGVSFLEETFSSSTAPPACRFHQKAARAVLEDLLPEPGTDIIGHMRSYDDLLQASGYARRLRDFNELLRILDTETRLITPTDPEGVASEQDSAANAEPGCKYYHLTHDYLVASIREWLARKRKETRRGRAELQLTEWAAVWSAKPENRPLPSLWETLHIRCWTRKRNWTDSQRKMMGQATRWHAVRWGVLLVFLLVLSGVAVRLYSNMRWEHDEERSATLVQSVLTAPPSGLPYAVQLLEPLREHALPQLRAEFEHSAADKTQKLHAALALASLGEPDDNFLIRSIAETSSDECSNLVAALQARRESATRELRRRAAASNDPTVRARLAIVALHLGDSQPAEEMLALGPDPLLRTCFIDQFRSWCGKAGGLADVVANADAPSSLRSGLCAAVGGVALEQLPPGVREELLSTVRRAFLTAPDGATHSAAGWALRQWSEALPPIHPAIAPKRGRDWYVNDLHMTMLQVPAGRFTAPADNEAPDAGRRELVIQRPFYLGNQEVSVEQFRTFIDDPDCPPTEKPEDWPGVREAISPRSDCPIQQVSWYDAVLFCNWVSRRSGLTPCYERTGQKRELDGRPWDVWRLKPDANGYRLPTEQEWEYACRAGTATEFSCGDDPRLLPQYAVFGADHAQPCGDRLPNGWGFHDMHGNVWEWCENGSPDGRGQPATSLTHVCRGGSFLYLGLSLQSASSRQSNPAHRVHDVGFRVARNGL